MHKNPKLTAGLVGAFFLTVIFVTIYVVAQQVVRMSANYPQTIIAEDLVHTLETGGPLSPPSTVINLAKDTIPFFVVYDDDGKALAASGELNNLSPKIPKGVLDHASKAGRSTLTWELQKGVRIATVVQPFKIATSTGYVVVGRSLRDAESLTQSLLLIVSLAWVVTLIVWCGFIFGKKNQIR